jgi:hypothetical protein
MVINIMGGAQSRFNENRNKFISYLYGTTFRAAGTANNNTTTIYTTPDSSLTYITAITFSIRNISGGPGESRMYIDGPASYTLFHVESADDVPFAESVSFPVPLIIIPKDINEVSSESLKVTSSIANCRVYGFCTGWTIDAT